MVHPYRPHGPWSQESTFHRPLGGVHIKKRPGMHLEVLDRSDLQKTIVHHGHGFPAARCQTFLHDGMDLCQTIQGACEKAGDMVLGIGQGPVGGAPGLFKALEHTKNRIAPSHTFALVAGKCRIVPKTQGCV